MLYFLNVSCKISFLKSWKNIYFLNIRAGRGRLLFYFSVIHVPMLNVPVWIIHKTALNSLLKIPHWIFKKNVELSNLVEQFGFLDFKDKMSTVCKKCQAPRNLRFIKEKFVYLFKMIFFASDGRIRSITFSLTIQHSYILWCRAHVIVKIKKASHTKMLKVQSIYK